MIYNSSSKILEIIWMSQRCFKVIYCIISVRNDFKNLIAQFKVHKLLNVKCINLTACFFHCSYFTEHKMIIFYKVLIESTPVYRDSRGKKNPPKLIPVRSELRTLISSRGKDYPMYNFPLTGLRYNWKRLTVVSRTERPHRGFYIVSLVL